MGNGYGYAIATVEQQFVAVQHLRSEDEGARRNISYHELLNISIPDDLKVNVNHIAVLYCLDANRDGVFSYDDLVSFIMWVHAGIPQEVSKNASEFSDAVQARCVLRLWADCKQKGNNAFVDWTCGFLERAHPTTAPALSTYSRSLHHGHLATSLTLPGGSSQGSGSALASRAGSLNSQKAVMDLHPNAIHDEEEGEGNSPVSQPHTMRPITLPPMARTHGERTGSASLSDGGGAGGGSSDGGAQGSGAGGNTNLVLQAEVSSMADSMDKPVSSPTNSRKERGSRSSEGIEGGTPAGGGLGSVTTIVPMLHVDSPSRPPHETTGGVGDSASQTEPDQDYNGEGDDSDDGEDFRSRRTGSLEKEEWFNLAGIQTLYALLNVREGYGLDFHTFCNVLSGDSYVTDQLGSLRDLHHAVSDIGGHHHGGHHLTQHRLSHNYGSPIYSGFHAVKGGFGDDDVLIPGRSLRMFLTAFIDSYWSILRKLGLECLLSEPPAPPKDAVDPGEASAVIDPNATVHSQQQLLGAAQPRRGTPKPEPLIVSQHASARTQGSEVSGLAQLTLPPPLSPLTDKQASLDESGLMEDQHSTSSLMDPDGSIHSGLTPLHPHGVETGSAESRGLSSGFAVSAGTGGGSLGATTGGGGGIGVSGGQYPNSSLAVQSGSQSETSRSSSSLPSGSAASLSPNSHRSLLAVPNQRRTPRQADN